MNTTINVGVVGLGYWGPNLVRNLRSVPNCRVKTVCDLNETRLRHICSLYSEVTGESDYARMLVDPEIHAVVIATSVRFHYPMAKASLEAGKHTMIEKPMATSTAECEELIEIANRNGLVLMVGHTFLYSAAVRKIKEIVDNRDIGDLRYISARRLNLGLFQKDINVTWDLAPHDISIILYIMQELPYSVNCRGGAHITRGIEDVTAMSLQFSKERSAIIHSSWHDPRKVREMTIVGSKRMIVYDDISTQEKIKIFDVRVERPPHYDSFAEFHYAYHYGDTYTPFIKQDEPLKTETSHFIDCIRGGLVPLTSGEAGMEVVRILEASSESLKLNGGPVDLRPQPSNNSSSPFPISQTLSPFMAQSAAPFPVPAVSYQRANGSRLNGNGSNGRDTNPPFAGSDNGSASASLKNRSVTGKSVPNGKNGHSSKTSKITASAAGR
jgi:predicted dehydrogenase